MKKADVGSFLRVAATLFREFEESKSEADTLDQIADSAEQPFKLAVVGRMKAGKSTLINGLIGKPLAISDVEEATATINWICYGEAAQASQFIVHWKDGRTEPYPLSSLAQWTGKTPEVLSRVKKTSFLRLFSDSPKLSEVQIVDTPGTGSAVEEHEISKQFLNPDVISESIAQGGKADAIIYVIPPVGREQDADTLKVFGDGRIQNSDPYNSVAVLHKWDSLVSDDPKARAKEKAHGLFMQLKNYVADVIPVSGPLACAARFAPDDFFADINKLVRDDRLGVEKALVTSDRWPRDLSRQKLREKHSMPWSSFKLLVNLCLKEEFSTPSSLRMRCEEESGILELETFLQERFYSQAAVIKQCQILVRAALLIEPQLHKIDEIAGKIRRYAEKTDQASELLKSIDVDVSESLSELSATFFEESDKLHASIIKVDRDWQEHRSRLELLQMDLRVARELGERPELFSSDDRKIIQSICNHLADVRRRGDFGKGKIVSLQEVENLISKYREIENFSRNRERPLFSHIVYRLEEVHKALQDL